MEKAQRHSLPFVSADFPSADIVWESVVGVGEFVFRFWLGCFIHKG